MRILSFVSIILTIFLIETSSFAKENNEQKVFDLIKQKKWQQSYSLANKINNTALKKVVLSQQFLDKKYVGNSFKTITDFILKNPSWPQISSMQINAENLLNNSASNADIFKFFSIKRPLTGVGYKYYAQSASKIEKDPSKLKNIVKLAWHRGSFSVTEQKEFYKKFQQYLTDSDNIKRIDNLLATESITAAKNSYYLVSPEYRKSFDIQIELINNAKASYKLKNIQKKYYTPGLIYRYLEARKKALPSSNEVVSIINTIKTYDNDYSDKIWKLQNYIAREHIEKKHYSEAYKIVNCHYTKNPTNQSDAEFLAGWLALRFLNKYELALKHFKTFNTIVKTPISKSRGLYWLARTYEELKDNKEASRLYYLASTQYPYTFYGQVAASELGVKKITLPNDIDLQKHTVSNSSKNNDLFLATRLVSKYGPNCLSEIYIKTAIEKAKDSGSIIDLAAILSKSANLHHMAWLTKYATQKHILIKNHTYPTPYKLNGLPLENSLVYSIIRQESVFDQHAISSAEAKGLMQLLNTTACHVAKTIGDKCVASRLTKDPTYNMKLGSHHLKHLVELFNDSYILAIAAYNAGPNPVNKWVAVYGDPRTMTNHKSVLDWIELIPFYETRNYVQRVLENLQIYRVILGTKPSFSLKQDLVLSAKTRGKK